MSESHGATELQVVAVAFLKTYLRLCVEVFFFETLSVCSRLGVRFFLVVKQLSG